MNLIEWRGFAFALGQDLVAILRDKNNMLPLARRIAWQLVGPSITELNITYLSCVVEHQNGLNCESHTRFHDFFRGQSCPVMMYHGRHVQMMSDSMATELLIHMIAILVCIILNDCADLTERHTRLTLFYSEVHSFTCDFR